MPEFKPGDQEIVTSEWENRHLNWLRFKAELDAEGRASRRRARIILFSAYAAMVILIIAGAILSVVI
ncbi:hypothetical protein [Gordonia rubripertincta]|uniref:hypothetical protein n=1 Tax=Gordonia rubripertincta TaxID=36822 RepID=UPI0015FB7A5E|nr:hypothetical protein [Gordonia rubripertincta]QMU19374.1 hypothetical protein H3V45_14880 [Gordonia rubripertincta]